MNNYTYAANAACKESEYGSMLDWDTSLVTNMDEAFKDMITFDGDISGWITSSVTSMKNMFQNASVFNQNIGNWDVSGVQNVYGMFSNAVLFNEDIREWDTQSITTMKFMFQHASSFNKDIGEWSTSLVTDMRYMFQYASAFSYDISGWKGTAASSVQTHMFTGANAFNEKWNCTIAGHVNSCGTLKSTWLAPSPPPPPPSPPPSPPPFPPPAQASIEASLTLGGYTKDTFGVEEETMFKSAISSILNISPGAIRIVSVENASSKHKKRKLLSFSDEIVVDFKVEASTYNEADSFSRDLVTIEPEILKQNLEDAGLTELTQVAMDENIVLAAPPPLPPKSPTIEVSLPPPLQDGESTGNSLITMVIGGVSAFVVGAPTLILTYIVTFATDKFKNKVRSYLLSKNLRWLADKLVPNLSMDLSELDEKVKEFMAKQKLPRLNNITPTLHEDAIKVDTKDVLGKGGFAVVYKGKLTRNNATVAVKSLFHQEDDAMNTLVPNDIKRHMQRESTVICTLNHPNIIKIFGVVPERGWIVMEYCAKGSLKSLLRYNVSGNRFKTSDLIKFSVDVATGVAYLHSPEVSIVHGDLKADNIMVRKDNSICVADFGLSEAKDRSKSMTVTTISSAFTMQWAAPELMNGKAKTRETDIFALGMTIWEIFECRNPFEGISDAAVVKQITSNVRPEISSKTPIEFREIIEKSWDGNPKVRPRASQIAVVLSQFQFGAFGSFKSSKYSSTTMKNILEKTAGNVGNSDANDEEESKEDRQKLSNSKSFWRSMTSKSMKSSSDGNESKKDSEKI